MKSVRFVMAIGMMLALAGAASAELCGDCKGKAYIKNIGSCVECSGTTMSGAFRLCMKCSTKLGECEHCRARLGTAIATNRDGTYTSGKWEYRFTIANKGTRSEGAYGKLLYDGKELPEAAGLNDHYSTPWGVMYWAGNRPVPFGTHGWMSWPIPRGGPGKLLADPSGAATTLVWAKVLEAGDPGDDARAEREQWVLDDLKKMGVTSVMVDKDWFVVGDKPVAIHDTKRFGTATVRLEDGKLVASTGEKTELAREDGTRKVLKCQLKKPVETLDLYVVVRVETAGGGK